MDNDVKNLGADVERFDRKIGNIDPSGDVYRTKQEIEDLEEMYKKLYSRIDDCDSDIQDSSYTSNKKPLINKLNQYRSDLEIAKNKLNEKKNRWKNQYNMELLKEGQLTGSDKIKTERNMINDQIQETDYQGEIIGTIAENIKDTNKNLEGINTELKQQGEQINRVQNTAMSAEKEVKQTEKIMTKMERRQKCMKIVGGFAVIIFAIFDIFWFIFWLIKKMK